MKLRARKKWGLRYVRRCERQGDVWWRGHHLRWLAEASPSGEHGGYRWPSAKPIEGGFLIILYGPSVFRRTAPGEYSGEVKPS